MKIYNDDPKKSIVMMKQKCFRNQTGETLLNVIEKVTEKKHGIEYDQFEEKKLNLFLKITLLEKNNKMEQRNAHY